MEIINLFYVEGELILAKQELEIAKQGEPIKSERHWRNFVNHLEKAFTDLIDLTFGTVLKDDIQNAKKFKSSDPLLDYIRNSRNTIHHSSKTITAFKLGKKSPLPNVVGDVTLTFTAEDGTVYDRVIKSDDWVEANFVLSTVSKEIRVKGKKKYIDLPPPAYHNGLPLNDPTSVDEVGNLALNYYVDLFNLIKSKNVK